jgi:hypothetical protein
MFDRGSGGERGFDAKMQGRKGCEEGFAGDDENEVSVPFRTLPNQGGQILTAEAQRSTRIAQFSQITGKKF